MFDFLFAQDSHESIQSERHPDLTRPQPQSIGRTSHLIRAFNDRFEERLRFLPSVCRLRASILQWPIAGTVTKSPLPPVPFVTRRFSRPATVRSSLLDLWKNWLPSLSVSKLITDSRPEAEAEPESGRGGS